MSSISQTTTLKEEGSYFTFANKIKLSEKLYLSNATQMRRVSFMDDIQVFLIKPCINYKLNKNITIGGGFMLFKSYPNGVNHASIKKDEQRIWQHLTLNSRLGKTTLSNRFVFEERFKDIIVSTITPNILEGTSYAQRFRYRIQLSFNVFKLKNNNYILGKVSNEIRIRFKTGLTQPGYDQNNFGAYLGCKLFENSKFWVGYGRDFYKINTDLFLSNDILHFAMSYDFDLSKKNLYKKPSELLGVL